MRCKKCKEIFEPKQFNQKYCRGNIDCLTALAMYLLEQKKKVLENALKRETKERKERLKTKTDYQKEVQIVFNKYIRERDKGNNCISCGKKGKKENAGHYRSVGNNPELRFNELNCHLQCEYCNTYLHGNYIDYRINLIKKIGIEKVEWLEGFHEPNRYTIDELKELKEYYKQKVNNLTNKLK